MPANGRWDLIRRLKVKHVLCGSFLENWRFFFGGGGVKCRLTGESISTVTGGFKTFAVFRMQSVFRRRGNSQKNTDCSTVTVYYLTVHLLQYSGLLQRIINVTTQLHLAPRLRMSGAIPLLPPLCLHGINMYNFTLKLSIAWYIL